MPDEGVARLIAVSCALFLGASLVPRLGEAQVADDSGLFRVWLPRGSDSDTGASPLPLGPAAEEALRARARSGDDPALGCAPPGMPALLETSQPVEFADHGDRISMRFAEWEAVRTIYMDPRNGPPVQAHSPNGVSFGRWEGDTLAIFTTYISYPYLDRRGTPQSSDVTVLERYTPSADALRLDWRVTITDPATFTAPVTRRGFMTHEPGAPMQNIPGFETACTVGEIRHR